MTIGEALLVLFALWMIVRPPWRFRTLVLLIVCTSALIGVGG
jgi:hypothetical protein